MSLARSAVKKAAKQRNDKIAEQAVLAIQFGLRQHTGNTILFELNANVYHCTILKAADASIDERKQIMDLLEENMRDRYETSHQGWSRREKQGELFNKSGRFVLVRDELLKIIAFVNWRFDVEECHENDTLARREEDVIEVAYCYEVQIKSSYRSQNLGKLLMKMLHCISHSSEMKKVMLTVFTSNLPARRFYERLDYSIDLISPTVEDDLEDTVDYIILSKDTTLK